MAALIKERAALDPLIAKELALYDKLGDWAYHRLTKDELVAMAQREKFEQRLQELGNSYHLISEDVTKLDPKIAELQLVRNDLAANLKERSARLFRMQTICEVLVQNLRDGKADQYVTTNVMRAKLGPMNSEGDTRGIFDSVVRDIRIRYNVLDEELPKVSPRK